MSDRMSDGVGRSAGDVVVRAATVADVDPIVAFEIEIAKVSFGDRALVEPSAHEPAVRRAVLDAAEGTFVASVAGPATGDGPAPGSGAVVGWAWVSVRANFRTAERYANFRSLAVLPGAPERAAQALMDAVVAFAAANDLDEIVGRVHAENVAMRAIYREYGFSPQHLTMRLQRR